MRYSELTEGVNGILYHGTSSLYRDEILKNGIGDPSHWGTQKVAMGFAKQKCRDKGGEPMIIAVSMSEFDQWQFSIDDNMIDFPIYKDASARAERWRKSEQDWKACLKIYGAVVYDAPIYVSAGDLHNIGLSEDLSMPVWQEIIMKLKALPYADKITIFGSVAKGTSHKHSDVDCFISVPPKGIMAIASQYYGSLDPFYEDSQDRLIVRNDQANGWSLARNARAIRKAIKTDGVPLLSLPDYGFVKTNISEDNDVPSLVPAILYNDMIFRGEKGQAHIQIAHEYGMPQMASDGERGFCDENGNFLNRKDAMAYAQQHNLLKPNIKTVGHDGFEYDLMSDHLKEDALSDIKDFKTKYNDPNINKHVFRQSPQNEPEWKGSIVKNMKKYGFELIGTGMNGAVFRNPKYSYVLKVYRNDEGYDEWLNFCQSHKNNKFVPKIQGKPIRLNGTFKAVRIEALKPCGNYYGRSGMTVGNEFFDKYYRVQDFLKTGKEIYSNDPDLIEIASYLDTFGDNKDLTIHNLMCRSNGQVVIIDPIYFKS